MTDNIKKIIDAKNKNELIVIVGTGVSIGLTNNTYPQLSWTGLIHSGLQYSFLKGLISENQKARWEPLVNSDDIDEILSAAEFVSKKLLTSGDDIYARWIIDSFSKVKIQNLKLLNAIKAIRDNNIPICTLNYDHLLEDATGLPTSRITNNTEVTEWIKGQQSILHLHGDWKEPKNCVLSIRDYEKTLIDERRDLTQRFLGAYKTIVFIGCGNTFSDPNLSALITWLRKNIGAAASMHFALVMNNEVLERHRDPLWQGFVEPVGYGESHSELPAYLEKIFPQKPKKAASKSRQTNTNIAIQKHEKTLDFYRSLLIKDCGQMTIEGVRADLDTAQRRFDIERLFVPLDVIPCPPEAIQVQSPQEEEGEDTNFEPQSFGEAFSGNKDIVLLALPGGGKTLLLKRLAAAYANPARLSKADDALPDLDLLPILIKCREWREQIKLPILNILKNIPEILGSDELSGFGEAIKARLKDGRILLLIDGLDEIHIDSDRTIFAENLQKFTETYPKIRTVITSREAGFSLVAPCLSQFCTRFRVSPLQEKDIRKLCEHWHTLMMGDSNESKAEAKQLSHRITRSLPLKRLAENPLLLTMLLVVKHGAGRLPPDRVSLYSRAVEVLLDTWNIKGHDALNPKEAVPQLAYIAFELMKAGKQTATEKELLILLEEARQLVPQIRLYAKDTPFDFLKRVELRSSLLVEAGHQLEGGKTVPFYQFRHLTFQEYLAATAVAEGNYKGYRKGKNILEPLRSVTTADEWKEVIPMTAVLAGKQAHSLIDELIKKSIKNKNEITSGIKSTSKKSWLYFNGKLPPAAARLMQCIIEEAEIEPESIQNALEVAIFFARGGRTNIDWKALCRGPYGDELFKTAWTAYEKGDFIPDSWMRNTCVCFAEHRDDYIEQIDTVKALLTSESDLEIGRGICIIAGFIWNGPHSKDKLVEAITPIYNIIENLLTNENPAIQSIAIWAWGLIQLRHSESFPISKTILDILLSLLLNREPKNYEPHLTAFAISSCAGLPQKAWTPKLSSEDIELLNALNKTSTPSHNDNYYSAAYLIIAYHSESLMTPRALKAQILIRSRNKDGHDQELKLKNMANTIVIPKKSTPHTRPMHSYPK